VSETEHGAEASTDLLRAIRNRLQRVRGSSDSGHLLLLLASGLAIRLALLPTPGFQGDIWCFTSWANTLRQTGTWAFYSHAVPESDYLPGYLYILGATAFIRSLFVGPVAQPERFALWIKLVPIVADLGLALVIFLLARRLFGPRRSLVAAAMVLFNPGIVFTSAIWGQVDSIGDFLSLSCLLAITSGYPVLAGALAGLTLMTKPQYCPVLVVAAIAYLRSEMLCLPPAAGSTLSAWMRWTGRRVLLPIGFLLVTVEALALPFSMSIWPSAMIPWTPLDRLAVSTTKFPFTSANAFNLWAAPFFGLWRPDSAVGWLSISFQTWGWILLAAASAPALLATWRRPSSSTALIWSCFLVAMAFFVLPTRMHERYLFGAVPLIAVAAAVEGQAIGYYMGVSVLYLANIAAVYLTQPAGPEMLEASPFAPLIPVGSALSVLLLLGSLLHLARQHLSGPIPIQQGDTTGSYSLRLQRGAAQPDCQTEAERWRIGISAIPLLPRFGITQQLLVLLAASAALLIARGQVGNDGAARSLVIQANRSWQGTGVWLNRGEQVFIAARGDWTNRIGGERFGPGGSWRTVGGTIMPSVPIGVLLGRVGSSDPFVVGEQALLSAPTSGELQLVMNDWPDDRHDVQGFVTVHIVLLGSPSQAFNRSISWDGVPPGQLAPPTRPPQETRQ